MGNQIFKLKKIPWALPRKVTFQKSQLSALSAIGLLFPLVCSWLWLSALARMWQHLIGMPRAEWGRVSLGAGNSACTACNKLTLIKMTADCIINDSCSQLQDTETSLSGPHGQPTSSSPTSQASSEVCFYCPSFIHSSSTVFNSESLSEDTTEPRDRWGRQEGQG